MSDVPVGSRPAHLGYPTEDVAGPSPENSTAAAAKEQAAWMAETAQQAVSQVAATSARQAENVAGESKRQVHDLLSQAATQAQEQASAQKQKASGQLRSVADELRSMVEGNGSRNEMITGLTQQFADKLRDIADWVEQREPADLFEDVRSVARRKPGTFLLGAALAGVAAGRLTRGIISGQTEHGGGAWTTSSATGSAYAQTPFLDGKNTQPSEAASATMWPTTVDVDQVSATADPEFSSTGSAYGEPPR